MSKCATQKSKFALLLLWLLSSINLTACDNKSASQSNDPNIGKLDVQITPTQTITTQTTASSYTTSSTVTRTASSQPFSSWQNRWIIGQPCRLPCWEGITVGKTRVEDAFNTLKSISPKQKYVGDYGSPYVSHYSVWTTPDSNNEQRFYYSTGEKYSVIYLISLIVPNFALKDVLKTYGQPSHIVAYVDASPEYPNRAIFGYKVIIIFESLGLIVSTETEQKPILNENMLMTNVEFFEPNNPNLASAEIYTYPKRLLVTWEGFKDFDYYCREFYSSRPIKCT